MTLEDNKMTEQEATHRALNMIAKVQMTNDGQWTFGNGVRYPTALGAAYAAVKSLLPKQTNMGQTMAECDYKKQDVCQSLGYCEAEGEKK
jgi:hypothetical protein